MQSYSFANKQKKLLEFAPHFATLVDELEEEYVFQFVFKLSQVAIATKFLSRLVVKCVNPNVIIEEKSSIQKLSATPPQKKEIITQQGKFEIDNILFKHSRQTKTAIAKSNSVIAETSVNLQSYIDPKVMNDLISGKKASEIESMYSYIDCLELSNNDFEVPEPSSTSQNDVRKINLELISDYLLHPIEAVNYKSDISIINQLRNYYTYEALQALPREKAYYSSIKKKKLIDKITIPVYLLIPKKLVQGSFDVQLEVLKFERNKKAKLLISEVPVERKTTTVNLLKHLKFFKQPVSRPFLESPTEDLPEVTATQRDANSDYIRIDKKEMNNRGECTRYSIACEASGLQVGETSSINEAIPDNKFNIFRCVSGDSTTTMLNPRIDGVVSGLVTPIDTGALVVVDKVDTSSVGAIEIYVKNPPKYAAQFQISKSTWSGSSFGKKEIIIPYRNFDGDSTLVVDDRVRHEDIYEYFLSYKTHTGEIRNSISRLHQYFKIINHGVTTTLTEPVVSTVDGQISLRMAVTATRQVSTETTLSQIANQQIKASDPINNENIVAGSSNQGYIIYHKATRVNLNNGHRENFGELMTQGLGNLGTNVGAPQFLADDPENRKKSRIEDMDPTADYLYEIRTFLRNPLSLIKDYVEQIKLPPSSMKSAAKIFSYRPHKWRQPSFLDSGTIPAIDEQNNLLTKKYNEDGQLGVTATYTLASRNKLFFINSLSVERVDENKTRVFWGLTGDINDFDHFVVVKEVNRVRSLLGAFIGQELFDFLSPKDVGTIIYYVIPVFYDFHVGTAVRSNSIVIDPEELQFKQQIAEI